MKVCLPSAENRGLESVVSAHFGSAPWYILHDLEEDFTEGFVNQNDHSAHGQCSPMSAMSELGVDTVIVGGLGHRALAKMRQCGIRVFQAIPGTVGQNLDALKTGQLEEFDELSACSGH
jgi:predicted Fe-Mo cluster-binding NifX family protein